MGLNIVFQMFTPSRTDMGTLEVPGDWGGGNWMSMAVDQDRQIAVMPLNNLLKGKLSIMKIIYLYI